RTVRNPRRAVADVGVAAVEQFLERIGRGGGAGQAARVALGRRRLEAALWRFPEAAPPLRKGGVEQFSQMRIERVDVGARRLAARGASRVFGDWHRPNMGRFWGRGKSAAQADGSRAGRAVGRSRVRIGDSEGCGAIS